MSTWKQHRACSWGNYGWICGAAQPPLYWLFHWIQQETIKKETEQKQITTERGRRLCVSFVGRRYFRKCFISCILMKFYATVCVFSALLDSVNVFYKEKHKALPFKSNARWASVLLLLLCRSWRPGFNANRQTTLLKVNLENITWRLAAYSVWRLWDRFPLPAPPRLSSCQRARGARGDGGDGEDGEDAARCRLTSQHCDLQCAC